MPVVAAVEGLGCMSWNWGTLKGLAAGRSIEWGRWIGARSRCREMGARRLGERPMPSPEFMFCIGAVDTLSIWS